MEKGSVSIYFVHSALEPIIERGMDAEVLLRSAGIAPTLLESPNSRVTAQSFSTLWRAIARAIDDELFGQDSRRMKFGSFVVLCETLVHCDTLHDALQRMVRIFNLMLDDFQCSLECAEDYAFLKIREKASARAPRIFGYETLLTMQLGVACWLVGRRIPILESAFAYAQPARSAEYRLMYSEKMRFDADVTSVMFERSYLDLHVVQNEHTAKEFVRHAPANIVLKYKNTTGLSAKIRRSLRSVARTEWPDFNSFAGILNMTPSTLRRRLEDEGQSFQAIKDQLRRDLAIDYLCRTSKGVADIAAELGFAEASAFHRAFKKWTGACPREYRQRVFKG